MAVFRQQRNMKGEAMKRHAKAYLAAAGILLIGYLIYFCIAWCLNHLFITAIICGVLLLLFILLMIWAGKELMDKMNNFPGET